MRVRAVAQALESLGETTRRQRLESFPQRVARSRFARVFRRGREHADRRFRQEGEFADAGDRCSTPPDLCFACLPDLRDARLQLAAHEALDDASLPLDFLEKLPGLARERLRQRLEGA